MGIICLIMGVIIGNQLAQRSTYKKRSSKEKKDNQETGQLSTNRKTRKTFQFKKRMKKYLILNKDSPEPIKPEQISIKIKKDEPERNKASPEPNPAVLALLWSHFKACSQGLLQENQPAPWERLDTGDNNYESVDEQTRWINFLKNLITDKSWLKWIKNPHELKSRVIAAYQGSN